MLFDMSANAMCTFSNKISQQTHRIFKYRDCIFFCTGFKIITKKITLHQHCMFHANSKISIADSRRIAQEFSTAQI